MLPRASSSHYRTQQRLQVLTRRQVRRLWRRMGSDFDVGWSGIRGPLMAAVAAAQLQAARAGAESIARVLRETRQSVDPEGQVQPQALVGVASDGRPLESLLYGGVTHAKQAVDAGESPPAALVSGLAYLEAAALTEVADTARSAAGLAITARPAIGWVRMIHPGACSRCAVLAGRWFRWNQGFDRHPRCMCTHVPAAEDRADDFTTDPNRYFDGLNETEQDRIFTKAGAKAIRDGADIGQVVNARRGMSTVTDKTGRRRLVTERIGGRDVYITREGITRRGQAYRGRTGRNMRARLMPESIYEIADGDRDEAVRLLKLHGYLT